MGPRATGKEAVATVVVDKMRRRMRQNGYHAHITLQAHTLLPACCCRPCCSVRALHPLPLSWASPHLCMLLT
jgi:hypothetical protein